MLHFNQDTCWVEGKDHELVIWIPPEFEGQVCLYPQLLIIGAHSVVFELSKPDLHC